ncbi:MAG: hypothetical protein JNL19_08520 [Burkholderiales bacterium]|nr:hypothetical protein [Burkholderiales bacterium]
MATTKTAKTAKTATTYNPGVLKVTGTGDAATPTAVTTARQLATSPTAQATLAMEPWLKPAWGDTDVTALLDRLEEQTATLRAGDTSDLEALLFNQALTLQAMFTTLSRRAALNTGEYLNAAETYLKLALRAQGQCRATVETLAEMKNPRPVAFVKQANIAAGHQQVNNAVGTVAGDAAGTPPAHAGARIDSRIAPNELLTGETASHVPALDGTATTEASRSNQAMAAVATLDRPANA